MRANRSPLVFLCGPSGSGKSTVASRLEKDFGLPRALTCTTRAVRPNETGREYRFTTREEFKLYDLLEYDTYNGELYGMPKIELDASDLAIMTLKGVEAGIEYARRTGRVPVPIYMDVDVATVLERLTSRGDDPTSISGRVTGSRMERLMFEQSSILWAGVINANNDVETVYRDVCRVVFKFVPRKVG